MGINDAVIFGHQRSGNHWLAALVARNVYGRDAYTDLIAPSHNVRPVGGKVLYITRNRGEVLRSVFAMRDRFGLNVDSYTRFMRTPYVDMYEPRGCRCMVDTIVDRRIETGCSASFAKIEMTPIEWYEYHNHRLHCGLVVSYDRLVGNMRAELDRIAEYLGQTLLSCQPIKQRVGWWSVSQEKPSAKG